MRIDQEGVGQSPDVIRTLIAFAAIVLLPSPLFAGNYLFAKSRLL